MKLYKERKKERQAYDVIMSLSICGFGFYTNNV